MSDKKQTAVEWLHNEIYSKKTGIDISIIEVIRNQFNDLFDQAKEMEKEQIIDSFTKYRDSNFKYFEKIDWTKSAENYYTETFKKQLSYGKIFNENTKST